MGKNTKNKIPPEMRSSAPMILGIIGLVLSLPNIIISSMEAFAFSSANVLLLVWCLFTSVTAIAMFLDLCFVLRERMGLAKFDSIVLIVFGVINVLVCIVQLSFLAAIGSILFIVGGALALSCIGKAKRQLAEMKTEVPVETTVVESTAEPTAAESPAEPTAAEQPRQSASDRRGISGGVVALIAVGAIAFLSIIAAGCVWFLGKDKRFVTAAVEEYIEKNHKDFYDLCDYSGIKVSDVKVSSPNVNRDSLRAQVSVLASSKPYYQMLRSKERVPKLVIVSDKRYGDEFTQDELKKMQSRLDAFTRMVGDALLIYGREVDEIHDKDYFTARFHIDRVRGADGKLRKTGDGYFTMWDKHNPFEVSDVISTKAIETFRALRIGSPEAEQRSKDYKEVAKKLEGAVGNLSDALKEVSFTQDAYEKYRINKRKLEKVQMRYDEYKRKLAVQESRIAEKEGELAKEQAEVNRLLADNQAAFDQFRKEIEAQKAEIDRTIGRRNYGLDRMAALNKLNQQVGAKKRELQQEIDNQRRKASECESVRNRMVRERNQMKRDADSEGELIAAVRNDSDAEQYFYRKWLKKHGDGSGFSSEEIEGIYKETVENCGEEIIAAKAAVNQALEEADKFLRKYGRQ